MEITTLYKYYQERHNNKSLSVFLVYFLKLKIGEITGKIYNVQKTNTSFESKNISLGEEILEESIRRYVEKTPDVNLIDLDKKSGFDRIGLGCFITHALFGNLIIVTQKNGSFYFKTKKGHDYNLIIDVLSIPKTSGKIFVEKTMISSFKINTLTKHRIFVKIDPSLIQGITSKISIVIDKCWTPNYLDDKLPDFPVGIGVLRISLE
ncbi:MAG: hypothetical protein KGI10_02810 [Thaumarchaeota archaeon]|nr:hypothetical protein [Nitrososphaerota archaeon]